MTKLLALVGTNIGEKRFEAGERYDAELLTERQRRDLIREGYAEEVDDGQRIPEETKAAIAGGVADPHEVVQDLDTKEV